MRELQLLFENLLHTKQAAVIVFLLDVTASLFCADFNGNSQESPLKIEEWLQSHVQENILIAIK